jgi:hypothetical protein
LDLLALWSGRPDPDSWVISRVLSNSWAADHGEVVKSILQEVISKTGETSHVSGALRALRRHGLEISL